MSRLVACKVGELADGEVKKLDAVEPAIALYRVGGKFFATADQCTHAEWSLGADGDLDGFEVSCTLHMARFDVRDGRALSLPACKALRTYPVEVVEDDVVVTVDDNR